jgi:hypothetical protein
VRFSYVPEGSVTPRRYRCQPDFEIEQRIQNAEQAAAASGSALSDFDRDAIGDEVRSWLQPAFTDIHYGLPAYCQLSVSSPEQIYTGAADGSEMGAFCFLKQPQRVTSLRVRLQEYLPFGGHLTLPGTIANCSSNRGAWTWMPTGTSWSKS